MVFVHLYFLYSSPPPHFVICFVQVCHDVSRGLFNEEEDEEMKERIVSFIQAGNILDRTCPGCYRVSQLIEYLP